MRWFDRCANETKDIGVQRKRNEGISVSLHRDASEIQMKTNGTESDGKETEW